MKRNILTVAALSAAVLTAGISFAQAPATKAAPAEKQQKLVKVATINGADANREFQANVQLLQAQRQAAIELNTAMEKEKDPAKKKELKAQFDAVMAKLNENNAKMTKAYGFSLTRNYAMDIESASIYMLVSDEEAAQIEKEAAKNQQSATKAAPAKGKK